MARSQPVYLPMSRPPLCERRQVSLRLTIDPISYQDWNRVYDCNCHIFFDSEESSEDENKDDEKSVHEEENSEDYDLDEDEDGWESGNEEEDPEDYDLGEEEVDSELEGYDDDDVTVYEAVKIVYEDNVISEIEMIPCEEKVVFGADIVCDLDSYADDDDDDEQWEEYENGEEDEEEGEEYDYDEEGGEGGEEGEEYEGDEVEEGEESEQNDDQELKSLLPLIIRDNHLVEIKPGLYIALVDGNDDSDVTALRTFEDKAFTHVLRLRYTAPTGSNWRIVEAPRDAPLQCLDIICPAACLRQYCRYSALDFEQLRAAREFLSLVLPFGSEKWWPEELRGDDQGERMQQEQRYTHIEQEDGDDGDSDAQVVTLARDLGLDHLIDEVSCHQVPGTEVSVLIVAPTPRAVDVLSILYCYLAFLEDSEPEDYMDGEYCDDVWERVKFGNYTVSNMRVCAKLV